MAATSPLAALAALAQEGLGSGLVIAGRLQHCDISEERWASLRDNSCSSNPWRFLRQRKTSECNASVLQRLPA